MVYECVLKCGKPCTLADTITESRWIGLKSKTQKWSGLDKYGDVYCSTLWNNGPENFYVHDGCVLTLSSSRKLEQAKKRKERTTEALYQPSCSQTSEPDVETDKPLPAKRLRSSMSGPLHDKTKCVWCM